MNQTQLIARTRTAAFVEDTSVDWTDIAIMNELNDAMNQIFASGIVKARQGYWKKSINVPVVASDPTYRLPARAIAGGLERIQIAYDASLDWEDLQEVDERLALNYELPAGQTGIPVRFVLRDDVITLLPNPNSNNSTLRIFYYLRPNRLVTAQTATNGLITAVNSGTRVITVSTAVSSVNETTGAFTPITSGSTTIDVISASGWHALQLFEEPATMTASGLTITCNGTGDMSTIAVGDFVRFHEQTDYPQIPDDFHRALADAAAVSILRTRSMHDKADALERKLGGDLERFGDLLDPRVKSSASVIKMPIGLYRGSRRSFPIRFP